MCDDEKCMEKGSGDNNLDCKCVIKVLKCEVEFLCVRKMYIGNIDGKVTKMFIGHLTEKTTRINFRGLREDKQARGSFIIAHEVLAKKICTT